MSRTYHRKDGSIVGDQRQTGLEKAPRWFLFMLVSFFMGAVGILGTIVVKGAYAEIASNTSGVVEAKGLAFQAKINADNAQEAIVELKGAVTDIREAQETFRKEYREDQKDMDRKLDMILKK